jgi:hypothetical protein
VTVSRVAAVAFVIFGLAWGAYQLVVLAPFLWMMGTRERMIARAGRPFGGHDDVGPPRGHDDVGPPRGSWFRDSHAGRGERPVRRFEIRHVGGRTMIVPRD